MTQHPVLRLELAGLTLIGVVVIFALCVHYFEPSMTCVLMALALIPSIVANDYQNFLKLGPGGTPSTFKGYVKITYLSLFALPDRYSPPPMSSDIQPSAGFYEIAGKWLPARRGPRPTTAGMAPHRQTTQPGCIQMYSLLRTTLEQLAVDHPDLYFVDTSCFEKKGLALFCRSPINATCRGEVCHVHDTDRSLHMNLHPDDSALVLEKGWGERHPLAKGGWFTQFVPQQFHMVYAPRDETELETVMRVIEAATYWVSGRRVPIDLQREPRAVQGLAETKREEPATATNEAKAGVRRPK